MDRVIIVTGASSGIGKATADFFSVRKWKVYAFSRKSQVQKHTNIQHVVMDINSKESIRRSIESVYRKEGRIDAIVNNAGFGAFGAFETSSEEDRQSMFAINVFALMNMTQEVLPYFRKQMSGTIVNVSSIGGLMTYPLFSIYHSSKWAVEGFSESVHYELKPFGIKVKIIEPGATKSNFNSESLQEYQNSLIKDYDHFVNGLKVIKDQSFMDAVLPETVAETIFQAVQDPSDRLRYLVGNRRSKSLALLRKVLPSQWFISILQKRLNLN
ncbi:short-chain dehydrogenase/reductase SDR [Leptospira ryugenii]|uniref:Short-chain dehydrogenase/reductase SDR n=1 Tax=Leptospira ryugenii TaxID=1917863 RepID=A0A2P2E2E1_9LEPT|nr:SDR family oxidoreductase [Leptospira ryugenii]GBF50976.1 short-chain dehydrogenase/reductase SDR [Leptospira ryugenii]